MLKHAHVMTVPFREMTPEELLGPLNEGEQKFAPKKLFVAGDTDIVQHGFRVAIVGTRKASREGLQRAKKLAKLVCQRHGLVVSGLAAGIDTAAHTAAIDSGGRTIAVIGTPLDEVFPKENRHLQALIMREHLCVSQFPKGYPTQRGNFPIRNRTMALIGDATVIVEAGEGSGSISQGWEALRLGRGLFIAKSLMDDPKLLWPKKMAAYGARVLSDDALDEFFESLPERSPLVFDGISF